jgi:hypothetical protein
MTVAVQSGEAGRPAGPGGASSLADVVDTILDKGLVIDAHVTLSVVGIQLVTIDARVVIASVATYLRLADAVNRLDLPRQEGKGLPEVLEGPTKGGAVGRAGEILGEIVERGTERARERREW